MFLEPAAHYLCVPLGPIFVELFFRDAFFAGHEDGHFDWYLIGGHVAQMTCDRGYEIYFVSTKTRDICK